MMRPELVLFSVLFCSTVSLSDGSQAQTTGTNVVKKEQVGSAIDSALSKDLIKLTNKSTDGDYAATEKASNELAKRLMQFLPNKSMLTDPLQKSKDAGLQIVSSSDHKLRYYTYDTNTGGTMHFFEAFSQYDAGGGKVKFQRLYPPPAPGEDGSDRGCGAMYTQLETVKTNKGRTIYLAFDTAVFDGMDRAYSIHAVEIVNGKLVPAKIFKTTTKLLDEISCAVHAGYGEEGQEISLTENGKKLLIPLLKQDGSPTGKYLNYFFDGNLFIYKSASK